MILRCASAAGVRSALLCAGHTALGVSPALVPTQIMSAKKGLISKASGEALDPRLSSIPTVDPDLAYAKFFAGLESGSRYEPVLLPADVDLILEIRFISSLAPGYGMADPYLRLMIVDPRTRTLLWASRERVKASAGIRGKQKREKNFDPAITILVGDLTRLASQPVAPRPLVRSGKRQA
jgi:hypothetical protein